MKTYHFDYDEENDSLFIYDKRRKTKASIELDDLIIDFNAKKEFAALEILHAGTFFADLFSEGKELPLGELLQCQLDVLPKNNTLVIKMSLRFKDRTVAAPLIVPTISEPSPAIAAV